MRMGPGDVPGGNVIGGEREDEKFSDQDLMLAEAHIAGRLAKLREQFPPERIEKLPKPMWRGAWDNLKGSNCPVCNGYHVVQHCIHLDYVGHANVTDRLLEVDPFWSWEPMSYTPEGLPLFVKEGLWIKLTVCGVTRIGFGDGASIKEVIGDAIRNAAMRFGVGLDLWAKIDLHAERNPGDGKASRNQPPSSAERQRGGGGGATSGQPRNAPAEPQEAEPAAPNQDALDGLRSVCDENGIDTRWAADEFERRYKRHVTFGDSEDIYAFSADLLAAALGPGSGEGDEDGEQSVPAAEEGAGLPGEGGPESGGSEAMGAGAVQPGGDGAGADPEDTSDVEKKPGDLF